MFEPYRIFLMFCLPVVQYWTHLGEKQEYIIQVNTGRSDLPAALSVPSFHLGVGPEDNLSPADYMAVCFYGNIGLCCHGTLTVTCWNKFNKYVSVFMK